MPRVKRGNKRVQRRKKILGLAKGYRLTKSKLHRSAKESVDRALQFSYRDGAPRSGIFAAFSLFGWELRPGATIISYSRFISGLKKAGIALDRRVLAEIAIKDPETFTQIAESAKAALAAA